MKFVCDNFTKLLKIISIIYKRFGNSYRKKFDNRLTELFDFPPSYNRLGNRNRKKVDNRLYVARTI